MIIAKIITKEYWVSKLWMILEMRKIFWFWCIPLADDAFTYRQANESRWDIFIGSMCSAPALKFRSPVKASCSFTAFSFMISSLGLFLFSLPLEAVAAAAVAQQSQKTLAVPKDNINKTSFLQFTLFYPNFSRFSKIQERKIKIISRLFFYSTLKYKTNSQNFSNFLDDITLRNFSNAR